MCGIAGYLGSYSSSWLCRANSIQAHRGPDDSGTWFSDFVGLAHTRLSILDLSPLGHQPMTSSDGRWHMVFNGEIYNFLELRQILESDGHTFFGNSDSEVLLALWQRRGSSCLTMLNGMFAFAVWDDLLAELTVVRDPSGIKPLFWSYQPQGFIFASEAKALISNLPPLNTIDADSLLLQLTYLWHPGPSTLHPFIKSLPPGSILTCKRSQSPVITSWCTSVPSSTKPILNRRRAVNTTIHYLRKAVQSQMVSDVPVGAFLSGGLDSSAVVALARQFDPSIECFTIVNQGPAEPGFVDDLPYARLAARHLNVNLTEVEIKPGDLADNLLWLLSQLDFPVADPAPLNVFHICSAARRHGIKVLLSGVGGDDLFTGYRRHLALQSELVWGWWPRYFRRGLRFASQRLSNRSAFFRRLAKGLELADSDPHERLIHYFRWGSPSFLRALISDPLQSQLTDPTASAPFSDWLSNLDSDLSRLQQMLSLEQRFFLADHNLHYTDSMSMAAGVEVRVPFLDPELVSHSWRLPDHFKQRGRCGKWVLKQAMADFLPHELIHRPKTGFGAPLRLWLQNDLRDLVADTLCESRLRADGLFNPGAVQYLLENHRNGLKDSSYIIWSLLCISLWWRSQR